MGFAKLRDTAGARVQARRSAALQTLRDELLGLKDPYWAEQVDIQRRAAMAWIARAEGKVPESLKSMRSAADAEDASEKHVAMESRLWPMRELLGELLLELKQPGPALKEFEKSLEEYPNRKRGFYGAARAADASRNHPKAADYFR